MTPDFNAPTPDQQQLAAEQVRARRVAIAIRDMLADVRVMPYGLQVLARQAENALRRFGEGGE